jgi:hypothetical protein
MAYIQEFILGDSKACCDVCGFDFKQSQLRKRWDGAMVCSKDYEARHPQDFVKARPERNTVKDARPAPEPRFVEANEITPDSL